MRAFLRLTIPADLEVLPVDWVAAGNRLRAIVGQPPYEGPPRYPTIEELEDWGRLSPGALESLRRCARLEAQIRWLQSWKD